MLIEKERKDEGEGGDGRTGRDSTITRRCRDRLIFSRLFFPPRERENDAEVNEASLFPQFSILFFFLLPSTRSKPLLLLTVEIDANKYFRKLQDAQLLRPIVSTVVYTVDNAYKLTDV